MSEKIFAPFLSIEPYQVCSYLHGRAYVKYVILRGEVSQTALETSRGDSNFRVKAIYFTRALSTY